MNKDSEITRDNITEPDDLKLHVRNNIRSGTLKKERRHSFENYELISNGNNVTIETIVRMSKADKF